MVGPTASPGRQGGGSSGRGATWGQMAKGHEYQPEWARLHPSCLERPFLLGRQWDRQAAGTSRARSSGGSGRVGSHAWGTSGPVGMEIWNTVHSGSVQRLRGTCLPSGGHGGRPSSASREGGLLGWTLRKFGLASGGRTLVRARGLGPGPQLHKLIPSEPPPPSQTSILIVKVIFLSPPHHHPVLL